MGSFLRSHPERLLFATVLLISACGSSGSGTPAGTGGTTATGGTAGSSGASGSGGGSGGTGATGGTAGLGGSAGAGGAAGQSGAAGSGPAIDYTNCATSADCGPNGTCQILVATVAGYSKTSPVGVCTYPIVEATACLGSPLDECCKSADCATGKCVKYPPNPECPDPDPPTPHNVCTAGGCGGCGGSINYCIPAGGWGYNQSTCLSGSCWEDAMCETFEPGSKCLPVFDACGKAKSIACVLPVIGCQRPSDCPAGKTCTIESGVALCK